MPRILVLQLKRIGDLVLTAPALAGLRAAVPEAEIVLVTTANAAELARCLPSVSRVIPYLRGRGNINAWFSALAGSWDACLDFSGTDRSTLLSGLSHASRRIGYARHASKPLRRLAFTDLCEAPVRELHTVDFHAALVEAYLGRPAAPAENSIPLRIPDEVRQAARRKLTAAGVAGPYAILHPGTVKAEKLWEAPRWAEVAAQLADATGLRVVLTGAQQGLEGRHLTELKTHLNVPVADMSGGLSLPELAAMIEDCALMLGVDSMAMHLAAMYRRPQVALFGPTNPFHWRPRHERAAVLRGSSAGTLTAFGPREKPCAMREISTVAVIGAIHSVLANPTAAA